MLLIICKKLKVKKAVVSKDMALVTTIEMRFAQVCKVINAETKWKKLNEIIYGQPLELSCYTFSRDLLDVPS